MQENSKELWKEFYDKSSPSFWFYIFKICGNRELADDIFQESCYRLLKSKPVLANEKHMKAYLYKTAYRLFVDKIRRIKVEKRAFEREKEGYKEYMYKKDQESGILSLEMEKTFKMLKPKKRILLWLAYVEGYTCNEIAELTESKENSVKVQLLRARKELAKILKQSEHEGGAET